MKRMTVEMKLTMEHLFPKVERMYIEKRRWWKQKSKNYDKMHP